MRFQAVEVELDAEQRASLGVDLEGVVGVSGHPGATRIVEATSMLSALAKTLDLVVLNGLLSDDAGRALGPSSLQVPIARLTGAKKRALQLALVIDVPQGELDVRAPRSRPCAGRPPRACR